MKNSRTSNPSTTPAAKANPLVLASQALLLQVAQDPEALMYLATRALDRLASLEHHYYGPVFRESWTGLIQTESWH